jgi:hypothetical protein
MLSQFDGKKAVIASEDELFSTPGLILQRCKSIQSSPTGEGIKRKRTISRSNGKMFLGRLQLF